MPQEVECLPSKHEALNSSPRAAKKKKKSSKVTGMAGSRCSHGASRDACASVSGIQFLC
jgi:hypothetical protein